MLDPRLLARLEHKKAQLDGLRPLPVAAVAHLNEQITIEWIYNSNAIEGSTLTLRETQLILETGLTVGGSVREHFEVIQHKDAIEYVESLAEQERRSRPIMCARSISWYCHASMTKMPGNTVAPRCASLAPCSFPQSPGRFPSVCRIGRPGCIRQRASCTRLFWLPRRITNWQPSTLLLMAMGARPGW